MQLKILLVEDDPYTAESVITLLKKAGMSPMISPTVTEAKHTISKHHPDIAIIDIMMLPGKGEKIEGRAAFTSGIVLATWIAKKYPEISMIGYSGVSNPEFQETFENAGGKFLSKLGPEQELVRTIRKVASSNKRPRAPVVKTAVPSKKDAHSTKVFIVHGHDDRAKWELKNYVQNILGLPQPVILHEQPNLGRTLIEKLENEAKGVEIVFVLLTPDDHAPNVSRTNEQRRQARPNVIFEMGFFLGRLGRRPGRVILLYKGEVELPTDIVGLVYIDISDGIEAAGESIRRELQGLI